MERKLSFLDKFSPDLAYTMCLVFHTLTRTRKITISLYYEKHRKHMTQIMHKPKHWLFFGDYVSEIFRSSRSKNGAELYIFVISFGDLVWVAAAVEKWAGTKKKSCRCEFEFRMTITNIGSTISNCYRSLSRWKRHYTGVFPCFWKDVNVSILPGVVQVRYLKLNMWW